MPPSWNSALKNMGIQATVQGVNTFQSQINKINKAIASQGGVISQVQAKFQAASARIMAADARRIASGSSVLKSIVQQRQTELRMNAAIKVSNDKLIAEQLKANAKIQASASKLAADKAKAAASIKVADQKTLQAQTKAAAQVQTATVKSNAAIQVSQNKLAAEQLKATAAVEAAKLKADAAIKASNDKVTQAQIKATAQVEVAQIKADTQMKIAQLNYQQTVKSSAQKFGDFTSKVSVGIDKLAGKFKFLSQAAGGIGSAIGGALGGPGGGIIGGGIGSLLGGIGGAVINIPLQFLGLLGKGILSIFNSITGAIKGVGGAINNLIFGPLSLFSLVLGQSVRNALQGIEELIQEIWSAGEAYQKLSISIQTLTAREIARQRGVAITDEITKEALGTTQALFEWMTRVSLTSPFTMQTIAESLKFSSAMGLSIKTTKNLVLATGNFAAAMGLSEDHQERIMYNLAQIYQQGKLTGREFRDLAISFVPVYDILGEMASEAGMTTEAFKKLALEGGVPVTEFFDHFIGYMNKNFPNAMEKMSRTMEGVRNNIKDFIQVVLGMEVLKPTMDKISGGLADVLNKLMTPEAHQVARDFGALLSSAFDQIREGVNAVGGAIKNLLTTLGFVKPTLLSIQEAFVRLYLNGRYSLEFLASAINTIAKAIKDYVIPSLQQVGMFSKNGEAYGQGFMYNFAHGIIVGVAKFLAKAIIYVTAFIKAFFAPGSPPKVAPEIDAWGGAMMDEWIGGMINETDWSALSKVGETFSQQFATAIPDQVITVPPANQPNLAGGQDQGVDPLERPGQILAAVQKTADTIAETVASVKTFVTEQGLKLAAAFMHGFSSGMYDALDAIKGPLKDAISALTGLGQIGEVQGIEMFYNFTQDAIAALDEFNKTGVISQKLLDEISQLGMGLGPELADLVKREFELAGAVIAAAKAQERLNAANKALADAHKTVNAMVVSYNNLLRAGANRSVLKAKLKEVNAGEMVLQNAFDEQQAAETNKELADERVTVLKEQADLQNRLVTNMIDLMNMQNEAMNAAKGGADDLAGAIDDLAQQIEDMDISSIFKDLDPKTLEDKFPWIKDLWEGFGKDFADAFNAAFTDTDTQTAADTLMTKFKNSLANILGMPASFEPTTIVEGVSDSLTQGFKNVEPTAPTGNSFFQRIVDWIFGGNVNWSNAIDKVTTVILNVCTGAIQKVANELKNPKSALHEAVMDVIIPLAVEFGRAFWNAVGEAIGGGMNQGLNNFFSGGTTGPSGMDFYKSGANKTMTWEEYQADWYKNNTPKGNETGAGLPSLSVPSPADQMSQSWLSETFGFDDLFTVNPIVSVEPAAPTPYDQGVTQGQSYSDGVVEGFKADAVQKNIDTASSNFFTKLWDSIKSIFGIKSPAEAMKPIGEAIIAGILQGVSDTVLAVVGPGGTIDTEVGKIIDSFLSFFGMKDGDTTTGVDSIFYNIGSAIVQGIIDGFKSMEGALTAAWDWVVSLLPEWAQKLLEIESPSKVMKDIGEKAVLGFAVGIEESGKYVKDAMNVFSPKVALQRTIDRYEMATYTPSRTIDASSQVTISFGDVYINDNMDWATFKARVQRAIVER